MARRSTSARQPSRPGLKLDDIDSPTKEGIRIVVDDNRILIAGQSDEATVKAVCRFLEHLGCRYFMDGPLGEVFPRSADLERQADHDHRKARAARTQSERPDLASGTIGKTGTAPAARISATPIPGDATSRRGHSRNTPSISRWAPTGKRKKGDWLCTSNPEVREMFANQVIAAIKAGTKNPSISPPDGRGYCQCDNARLRTIPM